ncbi:MAG: 4-hydroxy-tetrahydrodipicolinate reductase [Rickettsiales bacterium]|nr:MAG: 4-hydroxy-tetrahydrodipicolinate reductase [Rickettsiales bacterium]
MSIIKIGLSGANGRMGRAIQNLLLDKTDKFELTAKITSSSSELDLSKACLDSDIIIDFSSSAILPSLVKAAAQHGAKLVVGTTGHAQSHFADLKDLAKTNAILYASNTSIGANLIAMLAAKSAKILKGYDVEIIEAHHKHKKDAPSGTALMIGQKIADAMNINFKDNAVFDRASKGKRIDGEIGFASIRGGGIFGENEIMFAADDELVSISCRALSRDAFASGALIAAEWLSAQKAGFYSMEDVLEF